MQRFRNLILNVVSDLRFVLRQMRKSPGFAATVLLTLALGITSTTVIFSLVNAVLLQPLSLPGSDRLISLDTLERPAGTTGPATVRNDVSYPNFFDWRAQNKSFSSMASYNTAAMILGADANGPARNVRGVQVSSGFFTTLGVSPELGRDFNFGEEQPGTRTVVLSHDTWQSAFNLDPHVLGKTIVLSDLSYTVVGVMPKGFAFPVSTQEPAFWITMARDGEGENASTKQRGYNQLFVVGRLRSGVTLAQAKSEMDTIQQGLAKRYPDEDERETAVSVVPQLQDLISDVQTPLRILFAAVCCLLLIVCANVAGLLLTRTSQRRGEFAIRSALGATRTQILRQLLTESMVLSLGGGLLGIAASRLLLIVAPSILPANLPRVNQIAMSAEVLFFAIGISMVTGLLFGVLPAWRASQQDPAKGLAENTRGTMNSGGRKHYRLQSILVVAQTALGLVLLVGAGLLIHSFDRTLKVDPGFNPQQMLTFRISFPEKRYTQIQRNQFFDQLLPRLESLPGVKMATAAYPLPMTSSNITITFSIAGQLTKPGDEPTARLSLTKPKFFETLQIPLRHGRFFLPTEQSAKGTPVVIVNEAFAQQFFPGINAVGQHMRSGLGDGDKPPMREIVGVVGNVKRADLTEAATPEYYIPFEQAAIAPPAVAMRVTGDPNRYAKMISAEIARIDSGLPMYRFQSYDEEIKRITAQQRFQTMLLTAFAAVALILAGLGLYAVLSYMVQQRTTELGLRIALGASRANVLNLMLVRGLSLALFGLATGLLAAAVLTRSLTGLLYGVKPLDAATFTSMTLVLFAVSLFASFIPAFRASRLDPNETLRQQ